MSTIFFVGMIGARQIQRGGRLGGYSHEGQKHHANPALFGLVYLLITGWGCHTHAPHHSSANSVAYLDSLQVHKDMESRRCDRTSPSGHQLADAIHSAYDRVMLKHPSARIKVDCSAQGLRREREGRQASKDGFQHGTRVDQRRPRRDAASATEMEQVSDGDGGDEEIER